MPSDDARQEGRLRAGPSAGTETSAGTEGAREPGVEDPAQSEPEAEVETSHKPEAQRQGESEAQAAEAEREPGTGDHDGTEDQAESEPPAEVEAEQQPEAQRQSKDEAQAAEAAREPGTEIEQVGPDQVQKRNWRSRESLRAMRREAMDPTPYAEFDKRDNDASRLPPGEEVHLGGLVLAEAFTPSTISALKRALAEFPENRGRKTEWLANLEKGRSATGSGGAQSLGVVRRSGGFGFDSFDSEIPDAVDAIWPFIFSLTPSLTIVVATFTFKDKDSDLSSILRADYKTSVSKPSVHVRGRLGRIRQHIPWARPRYYTMSQDVRRAEDEKRLACEAVISDLEKRCWDWFSKRFPGRFSREDRGNRPAVRILLTKERVPFEGRLRFFSPVGLSSVLDIWNSQDQPGWSLSLQTWPFMRRSFITAAARMRDAAQSPGGDENGESIWYLTQKFAQNQSSLIARWAAACLLSLYADQLASLRDRAGARRKVARPVSQARDLDRFLIGDGLDASTIVSDIDIFTEDLRIFRFNIAEYSEDLSAYPQAIRNSRKPAELVPSLMKSLQNQAHMLKRDMGAATSNIAASAELRQAIANTTLQRRVLILAVVTIAIALASLFVAIHANSAAPNTVHSTTTNPSHTHSRPGSPLPITTGGR
jgi:hypothetical protein